MKMSDVTLKQLMAATPESIAKIQYDALQAHVLQVLNKIETAVMDADYESVWAATFSSPAGDGHGMDNSCINFTYIEGEGDVMDIGDACNRLEELRKLAYMEGKPR